MKCVDFEDFMYIDKITNEEAMILKILLSKRFPDEFKFLKKLKEIVVNEEKDSQKKINQLCAQEGYTPFIGREASETLNILQQLIIDVISNQFIFETKEMN